MLTSIKALKKELDVKFHAKNILRDESGRAVLEMNVRDDSSFLSNFSKDEDPVIASEVASYLEDRASALPPAEPLVLRIRSGSISREEKPLYAKAISSYFSDRYASEQRTYRKNLWDSFLMMAVGILFLIGMIVYSSFSDNAVWTEVLDIVAWVFIWEAVYMLMIENRLVGIKRLRCLSLADMKVEYIDIA